MGLISSVFTYLTRPLDSFLLSVSHRYHGLQAVDPEGDNIIYITVDSGKLGHTGLAYRSAGQLYHLDFDPNFNRPNSTTTRIGSVVRSSGISPSGRYFPVSSLLRGIPPIVNMGEYNVAFNNCRCHVVKTLAQWYRQGWISLYDRSYVNDVISIGVIKNFLFGTMIAAIGYPLLFFRKIPLLDSTPVCNRAILNSILAPLPFTLVIAHKRYYHKLHGGHCTGAWYYTQEFLIGQFITAACSVILCSATSGSIRLRLKTTGYGLVLESN